jgi:DME family drug/metabolite transporter
VEAEIASNAATPYIGRRYVLAAALLWSLGGVFAKSLELDGLTIALYRGLFAGLALLPFVPRRHRVFRPALLPLGLCFGAMTGLYIAAIKATTAANAIYLQCTATFWTIPLSAWLLAERPDRRSVGGACLATVGIAAIVLYGYDGRPDEWMGVAMGLASGLAYAGVVIGLRGLRGLDPAWLSAINNLLGAAALGAWLVLARGRIVWPGVMPGLALLAFGIIQMAIPYVLFARGLRDVGAPEASLIALVEPVLSPLWVFLATGERPAPATFVGGLFLLSGVAFRYAPSPRRLKADIADLG